MTSDNLKNTAAQGSDGNENEKQLSHHFKKIEKYFKYKRKIIYDSKHIPLEEILENAPKYYPLIKLIERLNIFLTKNKNWLQQFVNKNNISFDWDAYTRWKSGKDFIKFKYSDTKAPAKWIHVLQDYFIDLLESIQILLIMEFYIDEEEYKEFLKENPKLKFKIQANFIRPSLPSEDIDKIFELIDYLLQVNIENSFTTNLIIDTSLCLQVYRRIDNSKIFDILKQKEFYIKYRLEYLKQDAKVTSKNFPYKDDIIKIGENYIATLNELKFAYTEYKSRLIEKHQKIMGKTKK